MQRIPSIIKYDNECCKRQIRCSLVGWDTPLSPEILGFKSQQQKEMFLYFFTQ